MAGTNRGDVTLSARLPLIGCLQAIHPLEISEVTFIH